MTGNRATLVDIGEAVLVCEARMTVTDVIPQEIGAVITVFWVTGGRTPRTLINILCTILTLPLCLTGAAVVGQVTDLGTGRYSVVFLTGTRVTGT